MKIWFLILSCALVASAAKAPKLQFKRRSVNNTALELIPAPSLVMDLPVASTIQVPLINISETNIENVPAINAALPAAPDTTPAITDAYFNDVIANALLVVPDTTTPSPAEGITDAYFNDVIANAPLAVPDTTTPSPADSIFNEVVANASPVAPETFSEPAAVPKKAPLYANEMQCSVVRANGEWLLSCYDVLINSFTFNEQTECNIVDGLRACSAPISVVKAFS